MILTYVLKKYDGRVCTGVSGLGLGQWWDVKNTLEWQFPLNVGIIY
jgi:hypothetical protein